MSSAAADVWSVVVADDADAARVRDAVLGRQARLDAVGAIESVATAWARLGVRVCGPGDAGWDPRLERLGDHAPNWIAWRGAALRPDAPVVAIVGARRSTPYGREVAAWIAEDLARAGVAVVSGGAVGIDAAAHRANLSAGGRTVVVLGCGHAVAYPRPHAARGGLFDQIVEGGGTILSTELPSASPRPHRVRARNRIVAALADAVVVVEGAARSGTLVTAGFAADLGVQVFAVPGDVRAPLSQAPHQLLTEGAAPCTSAQDVLCLLERPGPHASVGPPGQPSGRPPEPRTATSLPAPAASLLQDAWPRSVPLDDLAAACGVATGELLGAITRARIAGEITSESRGIRLRRAPVGA